MRAVGLAVLGLVAAGMWIVWFGLLYEWSSSRPYFDKSCPSGLIYQKTPWAVVCLNAQDHTLSQFLQGGAMVSTFALVVFSWITRNQDG